eukprot:CAMPEP_0172451960 /NCGR_PEP_ID=MMETSP1065-20121228/9758_1 /TAXON_ID=265537 /ORGANISM="Amphiprora paludosa, Strain CCMP125" /LENGTH=3022 /DNA_ID=CAMNT_0013203931 /DNA_START=83 /DNA_END=9152 /DNA_ORIENTATION=-
MARRRRLADSERKKVGQGGGDGGEDLDLSLSDLQVDKGTHSNHNSSSDLVASKSEMGTNLQSIMERRRRLADGEKVEPVAKPAPEPEPEDKGDSLQAIMARRRKIADGEKVDDDGKKEAERAPEPPPGSLQSIMARRRRLADGESDPEKKNDDSNNQDSAGADEPVAATYRLSLAPTRKPTVGAGGKDLKSVGMSADMQKIMERRRRIADTERTASFAVDKEEDEESSESESEAPAGPKLHQAAPPSTAPARPSGKSKKEESSRFDPPPGAFGSSRFDPSPDAFGSSRFEPGPPEQEPVQKTSSSRESKPQPFPEDISDSAAHPEKASPDEAPKTESPTRSKSKSKVSKERSDETSTDGASSPAKSRSAKAGKSAKSSSAEATSKGKTAPSKRETVQPKEKPKFVESDYDDSSGSDMSSDEEDVVAKIPAVPPTLEKDDSEEEEEEVEIHEPEEDDETEAEDLEEALVEAKTPKVAPKPEPMLEADKAEEEEEDEVAFHAEPVPETPKRPPKKETSRREGRTIEPAKEEKKPPKRKKVRKLSKKGGEEDESIVDDAKSKTPDRSRSKSASRNPASLASIGSSRRNKGNAGDQSVASAQSGTSGDSVSKGSIPDDVSKMIPWESRKKHPGTTEGKVGVFQRDGKGIAAQWSADTKEWVEIGEVTGGGASTAESAGSSSATEPVPKETKPVRRRKSANPQNRDDRSEAGERRRRRSSRGASDRGHSHAHGDQSDARSVTEKRRGSAGGGRHKPARASSKRDVSSDEDGEGTAPPPPPPSRKKSSDLTSVESSAPPTKDTKTPPTEEAPPAASGFDAAWGDVPAFGASDTNQPTADAFGGAAAAGGFADFGDSAFGGNSADGGPVAFNSDAFRTDSNFENAFSAPSAFDPAQSSGLFSAKAEPVYDNKPLTGMPSSTPGKIQINQKTVMQCKFKGTLANNMLNGNVIICCDAREGAVLREVDTGRGNLQVMSTSIISPELRAKVATKYNASVRGLQDVLRVTAGLHESKGQVRLRVAAMLDLSILETKQPLRIVAVWEWGHGFPQPVSLQYIMSPPSGGDFSYETATLVVADNLLFLAGQSPKGPCVFISKPSLRESWTSNSLQGAGKVSSMEVLMTLDRSRPYLAVALTDKTLSVWTYKAAVEISAAKGKEQQTKRWLFPLCRLDSGRALSSVDSSSLSEDGKPSGNDSKNAGFCTHLAWRNPRYVGTPVLMIAASFQNGLAIFHVSLPIMSDKKSGVKPLPEPTSGSTVKDSPRILPIVAKRWQGKHERSSSAWLDFGPHVNPCLSVLLQPSDSKECRFIVGAISIPLYRRGPMTKEKLLPFRIFTSKVISTDTDKCPSMLLPSVMPGTAVCYSEQQLYHMVPHLPDDSSGASIASLWHPIASQSAGLTSIGDPLNQDSLSDKDGILHIFSSIQCERNKADSDGTIYDWSRPTRRHWICRTVVGDNKTCSFEEAKEERATSQFGDGDTVLGGAASEIICEIYDENLVGLAPLRLIRCPGVALYAVLMRHSLCSKAGAKDGASLDATVVVFVDLTDSGSVVQTLDARDVVFIPSTEGGPPRGLLLAKDGLSLTYFSWDKNERKCTLHEAYRPILGVEDNKDYVECKRIFVSSGSSTTSLLAVATRLRDFKTIVISGELVEISNIKPEEWSELLPNIVEGRAAWLNSFEDLLALAGLEGDDSGYRNFSAVTSQRVVILSSAMEVAAECLTRVSSCSLSPLGAFAVGFVADRKVRYLCCLDGELSHGIIATLTARRGVVDPYLLLAIRQDRIIGTDDHKCTRLIELGQKVDYIFLPTATTKPALLLEPLVANAVTIGGNQDQSTPVLRSVIEKFGRVVALAHGENEGIGNLGTGLTSRVFQILGTYGLKHAASWLLTGTVQFDRTANTTLLPPWLPLTSRTRAAFNSDAVLQLLSNGDQYFSDYVKDPDGGVGAALPRMSDPVSYLSQDLAIQSLTDGGGIDALKTLDISGSEYTEAMIVQLSLVLEKDKSKDVAGILNLVSGFEESGLGRSSGVPRLPSSVAALALSQKIARASGGELVMEAEHIDRWMKPLAPSLQKGGRLRRVRNRLIGTGALSSAGERIPKDVDPLWTSSCKEAKHVWNEGPSREKDKLLMLDRIEDWVGRRRPIILGKEGASAARDRGALADILNMDENSFGGKSDLEDDNDGWIDGVGEGRSDEANLSTYFRFSEGEDEENPWRTDGLLDLTTYQNKATLLGDSGGFSLETSTSSVDEGEPGKVKSLFDLVFASASLGALVVPAPRGGSLDVGVLHTSERQSRQRCTIEFWYNVPSKDLASGRMVLARRTLGASADDLSKASKMGEKESVLWELVLKSSGELVFSSCGGSTLRSTQKHDPSAKADEDEPKPRTDLVNFGKWNHVCVVLSSKGLGLTECSVSMLMMGHTVAESKVSMLPSGFDEDDLDSSANLKELLQKSHMLFGLNNPSGFRMTELRVWACARSDDDVNTFMREYLNAAEGKKKFKVKIKSKKGTTTLGKGLLAKPGLGGPNSLAPKGLLSLAPTPKMSLAPQKKDESPSNKGDLSNQGDTGFAADFNAFGISESGSGSVQHAPSGDADEEEAPVTLWDTALPLSQQVRSSAAAALIRGPPATRHFGGNRGGLPDFSGMERFGVGGIAICGSEKTIVWRDNEDPPALTYPIGASGAIVSDQMDDEGSEFLCCFLARDKRMVVFELQSRTVVVELQMTTKLNFWRFLPPEAGENTLCFMLVTPVGGFHWMPLDESPRPQQVWKRGPDLAGKKVVAYEEGGSNGLDGPDILSRVGLIMVTKASGESSLESWIVPIAGDSVAVQVSDDVMGGCLCLPPFVDEGPFLPLLVAVLQIEEGIFVNVMSLIETQPGSVGLGEIAVTLEVDLAGFEDIDFEPPALAMGTYPEAICCSLANIVVVLIRRKGLIVAFELEDGDMSLIAREGVDHYVIDAVMRYSAEVGGAEIVMLLADDDNPKEAAWSASASVQQVNPETALKSGANLMILQFVFKSVYKCAKRVVVDYIQLGAGSAATSALVASACVRE